VTLRFTNHARRRLAERGVSEEQIQAVMRRPLSGPDPGSRPDTVVFSGHAEGVGMLKVVVDAVDRDLVVSVFWLADAGGGTAR
jgi:hypothetical protein